MKKLFGALVLLAAGSAGTWFYLAGKNPAAVSAASTPAASAVAQAQSGPLVRIALEGKYPPFEYLDQSNQLTGFNVDLANALCKEMQVRCEISRFDFDQLIPALNDNKADAIVASLSITEEREKLVNFSEVYSRVPGIYVATKKAKLIWPVITAERIKGSTVGVVAKTTFDDYLTHELDSSKVTIKRFGSADEMMAALANNQIQLVFDDSAVLGYFLKDPKNAEQFEMVGNRIDSAQWLGRGEAIALRKGDDALREKFNVALRKLIDSGEHQQLGYKYFTLRIL
ncbi:MULTISPECIES: transporter substrate-binding domain-containing protein [Chitinibacter]|uniref:transporter substrate-binding domain-containing protein n=1 Tax=Chitinibacter TaxID=230666 RepID=UPI000409B5D5|nr:MULTISPECIES: transporter substrate-binding domain-containing protein [Chitinibacter]